MPPRVISINEVVTATATIAAPALPLRPPSACPTAMSSVPSSCPPPGPLPTSPSRHPLTPPPTPTPSTMEATEYTVTAAVAQYLLHPRG